MSPGIRPGEGHARLARLIIDRVARTSLDLTGLSVLTEAASGPYIVTPIIAALAGAEVVAVTADSKYGTASDVTRDTLDLAERLGVRSRIQITSEKRPELFRVADVVTNSGHLRPITGQFAASIRNDAVVSLMFENWEIQAGRVDLELEEIRARGIAVAGTNERHPEVDVFSYLGPMAVAQLADAGVCAYRGRVALYCNNPFLDHLTKGLGEAGAEVLVNVPPGDLVGGPQPDAVVVATTPGTGPAIERADLETLAQRWPDIVFCQFWGELDREACTRLGVGVWPTANPGDGHMGVLPSRVGPEPIIRLQAGGLKVAQVLHIPVDRRTAADMEWLDV